MGLLLLEVEAEAPNCIEDIVRKYRVKVAIRSRQNAVAPPAGGFVNLGSDGCRTKVGRGFEIRYCGKSSTGCNQRPPAHGLIR